MSDHGIIMSAPMVLALLERRKTVTRRFSKRWLRIKSGDVLWVRESMVRPDGDPWLYSADKQPVMVATEDETAMVVWAHHKEQDYCPSIHMPRWASRITLEATEDARAERLLDITEQEAMAEGSADTFSREKCPGFIDDMRYKATFSSLWDSLHTKPGERWSDNPEVIRISFKVVKL